MRDYAVRDKSNHSQSKKRGGKKKKVAKFMYHVTTFLLIINSRILLGNDSTVTCSIASTS